VQELISIDRVFGKVVYSISFLVDNTILLLHSGLWLEMHLRTLLLYNKSLFDAYFCVTRYVNFVFSNLHNVN